MLPVRPRSRARRLVLAGAVLLAGAAAPLTLAAQQPDGGSGGSGAATAPRAPRDPMQEGLPLTPTRTVEFTTREGSWMSVDVSPDGATLVFDLLGDLYTMPIAGGRATPLTRGMGMDAQPRISPDGRRVVFVSDRDGDYNLWILSLDGRDTVQLTRGRNATYESPEWTPDGEYVVATRNGKLHLFHVRGGAGQQLIREPASLRTIGAAFGADPRYVWYARRTGNWLYNSPLSDYQLAVYDRETGTSTTRTFRYGSGFRPTLSPDGRWLVYGTRHIAETGLRLRDLQSGDERWLAYPVQRDDQESRASLDVYPGMAFTPDSRALVATYGGRLWRIPLDGGAPAEIPFEVPVKLALGPAVEFEYRVEDTPTFTVRQVRDAVPSPDGRQLAFVAMDRLWVMDWPNGTPRRVTDAGHAEHMPTWSPDGRWLAYTTWSNADGGHLWKARADGRAAAQRLTTQRAFYQQPAWAPDGRRIVAVRGPAQAFTDALTQGAPGGATELVWVPASGGTATFIAPTNGLSTPHFTHDTSRVFAYGGARGLVSMRWDGTDVREIVKVTGAPNSGQGFNAPAASVTMAPRGDRALVQANNDLYVVVVPYTGGPTTIAVGPESPAFPVRRLTEIGGQFPAWSRDGQRVHWSIGNAHFVYDLDAAQAFDDSVRVAQRARADSSRAAGGRPGAAARPVGAAGAAGDSAGGDSTRARRPQYQPVERRIALTATRDIPHGTVVLRGARAITMRGQEVIDDADIVVTDNRIVAVGARGQLPVPAGARIIDVAGKTIVPGFVDTHAHLRASFGVHRDQVWSYAANLAYGVTTARDPQTGSTDVLSYEDQVAAGVILGPRIYSTGPGVFSGEQYRDLDHARRVLRRYSDYYDTKTIKQYGAGNRQQRQWIIQAARELKLMPTTEGSLDIRMNVTEAFDGYSGHEHSWPTFPLYGDLIRLFAESRIVYTPTILVAYGGPWSENYFYATENVVDDAKLRTFTPWSEIEAKALRRGGSAGGAPNGAAAGWFHPSVYVHERISQTVRDLIAAGGRAGVGSHGQLQGLGYHWELWAMQSGGLAEHDALRAATIMGAEAIGLHRDLGSIEPGKLADLVILDANPLENIRHSNSVRLVMKNGRLYDGASLDELWPRQRTSGPFYWQEDVTPRPAAGIR